MDKDNKRALFLIILFGAALRIWGIAFGLPYQFHQDEPIVVNHALAYGTGDFNPHFFIIPPLTSYILFFIYGAYYLLLSLSGCIRGVEGFAISFFKDPTPFYLIGRIAIGAIPSVFNIYLTYKLALKFFSRKAALYSAIIMAVAFLNVANGHYIYTDNLLVTFILLSYIMMALLIDRPLTKYYIFTAVFTGMAIATKYNAALLLPSFFVAHLISCNKSLGRKLCSMKVMIFMAVTALSFLACNPYSVLDWKLFLTNITKDIWPEYTGWTHHITYSMFQGIGVIPAILGIAGLIMAAIKGDRKVFFLVSFPLVFYFHLVFRSQLFSRYSLPMIPFLSVGAGFILFDYLYPRFKYRRTRIFLIIISLLVVFLAAVKSVKADIIFTRKDTRTEATEWIERNISPDSKIALDSTFFGPQLKQSIGQLKEKKDILGKQPELKKLKDRKLDLQIAAAANESRYELYYLIQGREGLGQFLGFWPVIEDDIAELNKCGIKYIVLNNMTLSEKARRFNDKIAALYKPIAQFNPYDADGFRRSYDEIETTCIPILDKELFSRRRPGPYIIIYRIK